MHQGIIRVDVELDPTERELNPQVTRLGDALQREHDQVTYLGFPEGRNSSIRMRYNVPPSGLPNNPALKLRAAVMGRANGPLAEMTMSYYRIPRVHPVGGTEITQADTSITFDVVTPSTDTGAGATLQEDHVIEVESDSFTIEAGDTVFVTLSRSSTATPVFQADIGIIRIGGVIIPGD